MGVTTPASTRASRLRLLAAITLLLTAGLALNSLSPSVRVVGTGILAVVFASWMLWKSVAGQAFGRLPPTVFLILLIVGFQGISLLWTPLPRPGAEILVRHILLLSFLVFVFNSLRATWSVDTWLDSVLLVGGGLALVELLLAGSWLAAWRKLPGVDAWFPPVGYRTSGLLLGHPNNLSAFLNLLFPLLLMRIVHRKKLDERIAFVGFLGMFAAVQFLTSSRGGWVAGVAGLATAAGLLIGERVQWSQLSSSRKLLARLKGWRLYAFVAALGSILGLLYLASWQVSHTSHAPIGQSRLPVWQSVWPNLMRSPILGTGLGSFPPTYAGLSHAFRIEDIPHAHSLPLQIWLESGLVSLILAIAILILIVRRSLLAWKGLGSVERSTLIGVAGALMSLLVHGLVDYALGPPLYTAAVLVFVAVLLRITQLPSRGQDGPSRPLAIGFALMPLVGALALFPLLTGAWSYWDGLAAVRSGDLQRGSSLLCTAWERSPGEAAYATACGLSLAQTEANSGEDMGTPQLQAPFAGATEGDPYWYRHWLNLATVQRSSAEFDRARDSLATAQRLNPRSVTILLNRGYLEELAGRRGEARDIYEESLRRNPRMHSEVFFVSEPWRLGAFTLEEVETSELGMLLLRAEEALHAGHSDRAAELLEEAGSLSSSSSRLHALLARQKLVEGDGEEAWVHAHIARFISRDSPSALTAYAQVARSRGMREEADEAILSALEKLIYTSESQRYYFAAHGRASLPWDVSPFTIRSGLSQDLADASLELYRRRDHLENPVRAEFLIRLAFLSAGKRME